MFYHENSDQLPEKRRNAMREYFSSLFNYNEWANQKLLITLQRNKINDEKVLTLYHHILVAQDVWLARINNQHENLDQLWTSKPLLDLIELTHNSSSQWKVFIDEYPTNSFEEVILYKSSKGVTHNSKLGDIIIHVANHGTHHRGQIIAELRSKDIEPPSLDFIFYKRDS